MKIAIIGSTGILGTAFVEQSQVLGFEFEVFNRVDLANFETFERRVIAYKPDYCVCTIAIPSNRLCLVDPAKATLSNLSVPLSIARAMKKLKVKTCLFSSHGVFRPLNKLEYFYETCSPDSDTFYGILKIELERTIADLSASIFTMLRLPSLFGKRAHPGEKGACERILNALILNQNIEVRSDMYDSYTLANDVANFVLENLEDISKETLLHFANEGIVSMAEFAEHAKTVIGSTSRISKTHDGSGRIYCSALASNKKINNFQSNSCLDSLEKFARSFRL